jgi:hypothetical protein
LGEARSSSSSCRSHGKTKSTPRFGLGWEFAKRDLMELCALDLFKMSLPEQLSKVWHEFNIEKQSKLNW